MDSNVLLIDAAPEKTFYLFNGKPIRNLSELVSELENMGQGEFAYHCNDHKDDFATWIDDALKLGELAGTLRGIKDNKEYVQAIKRAMHPPEIYSTFGLPTIVRPSVQPSDSIHSTASNDMSHKKKDSIEKSSKKKGSTDIIHKKKDSMEKKLSVKTVTRRDSPLESPLKIVDISKQAFDQHSNELAKLKAAVDTITKANSDLSKKLDNVEKLNSDLNKKLDAVDKTNSELNKKVEAVTKTNPDLNKKFDDFARANSDLNKKLDDVTKTNSDLNRKFDDVAKVNSDLNKKLDNVTNLNSELTKKTDVLRQNVVESQVQVLTTVSSIISKYFADKDFKNKVIELLKPMIVDVHSKDRNVLKSEINKVVNLNEQLDKKLAISLSNRTKEIEKIAHSNVSEALSDHMLNINNKIDKAMESKIAKLEQSFDKKAEGLASANLIKYKNDIDAEKHNLRAVASEVMHREFEKMFNNDEHVTKIVAKYQKMFTEGADNVSRMHKQSVDKLNDELAVTRDKVALESQQTLNKQLADTIKKQRDVLDLELSKALTSNKYFVSRFEKEILNREKLFLESADRRLKENYTKHDGMLGASFSKYNRELNDLKLQFDKDFKARESQFNESINSKIHESMNKEFSDVLVNQRNELSESIAAARVSAVDKIEVEFTEVLSKHKQFMLEQFNKATVEQNALKEKFVAELKAEEVKILAKVKDMMQMDLTLTINNQRDLLDKELAKTVLANKYFVERFEKEIMDMHKELEDSGNKVFEKNYVEHKKLMQALHAGQIDTLKKLIADADNSIANKEAKIYANLNATIPASVRESVNKEFSRLILDEKKALEVELKKAEDVNKSIEKKFEDTLNFKAQILIDAVSKDANTRFGGIIALQQKKLDEELLKARKSYEVMEVKKNDIIEKTNLFIDEMSANSANKLKELEREQDKHLKKVSQITLLITRAENALNELKDLKAEVSTDKKNVSKESKDYSQLMSELTELRNNLSQEKTWIATYRTKVGFYNMITKCSEYIKAGDGHNAKLLYNKIADTYAHTPFEKVDKIELYNSAAALLKEIQKNFGESLNSV